MEYNICVGIDNSRTVQTFHNGHYADTMYSTGRETFVGAFPSHILPHSFTQSGIVIVNSILTQRRVRTGSPFISNPVPTALTTLIPTASSCLFQLSKYSWGTIASSRISTWYNCRVRLVRSVANIAVYSPSIWIGVTPRSISSANLIPTSPTEGQSDVHFRIWTATQWASWRAVELQYG